MPNWCTNRLTIRGPESVVASVRSHVSGPSGGLDFNSIIPMPAALKDIRTGSTEIDGTRFTHWREVESEDGSKKSVGLTADEIQALKQEYEAADWYDWSINHWGTKWNVDGIEPTVEPTELDYIFDTAWSPPTAVIERLAALFPKASIIHAYVEEGVSFGGVSRYEGGILVDQTEGTGAGIWSLSEWHESMRCSDDDDSTDENDWDNEEEE